MSVKESVQATSAAFLLLISLLLLLLGVILIQMDGDFLPETAVSQEWKQFNKVSDWAGYMARWEREYGVPVHVQRALMAAESGGQPLLSGSSTSGHPDGRQYQAQGLFQVIPYPSRLQGDETDLFDPDANAREGFRWLIGCNTRYSGTGETDWYSQPVLRDTFACYHGGDPLAWGAITNRYADNVVANVIAMLSNEPDTEATPGERDSLPSVTAPSAPLPAMDNYCEIAHVTCGLDPSKADAERQGMIWQAGWYMMHGYTADRLRDEGQHELARIADCLGLLFNANYCWD